MNIRIVTIYSGFSKDILILSGFIHSLKDDELKSKNRLPHCYIFIPFHETKFTDHWKFGSQSWVEILSQSFISFITQPRSSTPAPNSTDH